MISTTRMQLLLLLAISLVNLQLFSSHNSPGVAAFDLDFLRGRSANFAPEASDFGRYIGFADDEDNAGFTSDVAGGGGLASGAANPVGTRRLIQPPPLKRALRRVPGANRDNAAIYRWLLTRRQSPFYHLPKI